VGAGSAIPETSRRRTHRPPTAPKLLHVQRMNLDLPVRSLFLYLSLASACLVTGCAADPGSGDGVAEDGASAIKRGEKTDATLGRPVVQVYTIQTDRLGATTELYCTGVLVAPRKVVTSISCFTTMRWAWQENTRFELTRAVVRTGPSLRIDELVGGDANVAHVSPYLAPDLAPNATTNDILRKGLAILTLKSDLQNGIPLALGQEPTSRDDVTIAGYGCDGSASGSWGTLRSRRLKWNAWTGWFGTSFSCAPGDPGAGVLDASGRLVGIATIEDRVMSITADLRAHLER
jgi:hypothetical protein